MAGSHPSARRANVAEVVLTLSGGGITYTAARPPSTSKSIPVMKLLSSEARNTAAEAISSGSSMRPIGTHRLEPFFHRFRVLDKLTFENRCLDGAGADHIRADSFACQVRRSGAHKRAESRLGSCVSRIDWNIFLPEPGAGQDDRSAILRRPIFISGRSS
jgi:hypothetical protein